MFKPWDIVAWLGVFFFYAPVKLLAKILAPIAVLFVNRLTHPVWGVSDATDFGYWNTGFRNGAHNLFEKPQVPYVTYGSEDETLEKVDGFQWRYRRSTGAGNYVSFRCTWGEPRNKGKREFYIGWTLNERPTMRPTFLQFRPF